MQSKDSPEALVTVIVCTRNRADLLARCLSALARQDARPQRFRVLVVDNASTDATRACAATAAATAPYVLEILQEPVLGLSHARNAGARASRTPWLAYIDDDAMPWPNWMTEVLAFIESHPEPGVFGGPYVPFYLDPPPRWLPADLGRFWQGDRTTRLPWRRDTLIGCNFMTHCRVFEAVGGFDPDLGVRGDEVRYGEETMFYRRALELGFPAYYTPGPVVEHLVRPEKYRLAWHAASLVELGKSLARKLGPWRAVPAALVLLPFVPLLTATNFCVFLDVPLKRRVYFALHPPCYAWGMLLQCRQFLGRAVAGAATAAKARATAQAPDRAGPGPA